MRVYRRDDLIGLFPAFDWDSSTVVRCTRDVEGEGKWIRASQGSPRYGHVRVQCRPAFALSIALEHEWPDAASPEVRASLDRALLTGLVEGLASGEYPAWLCEVRSTDVTYVAGDTVEGAVRVAARQAVESALGRRSWRLITWPRGATPQGDEPA